MNIISKVTINGKTQINGRYINLTGQNVSITDNGIYVNGKPIEEFDESQVPVLRIEITGNVESLTTENGEITVNGRVGTVSQRTAMSTVRRLRATWRARTAMSCAAKSWETVTQRTATSCVAIKSSFNNISKQKKNGKFQH